MLLYADRVQIAQLFHLEGGKKRAQNKVYEQGSWAASPWVGEPVWPHISSKVIALRLEPRCDNTLCGQGTSHNLKENNSFPSFPNRGERHSLKDQRVKYLLWCRIFLFCLKLQQEPVFCINKTVTVSQGRVTFLSPMRGTVLYIIYYQWLIIMKCMWLTSMIGKVVSRYTNKSLQNFFREKYIKYN